MWKRNKYINKINYRIRKINKLIVKFNKLQISFNNDFKTKINNFQENTKDWDINKLKCEYIDFSKEHYFLKRFFSMSKNYKINKKLINQYKNENNLFDQFNFYAKEDLKNFILTDEWEYFLWKKCVDKSDYYKKWIFKILMIIFITSSILLLIILWENSKMLWYTLIPGTPIIISFISVVRMCIYYCLYKKKLKQSIGRDYWLDKHISNNLKKVYKNIACDIKEKYSSGKTYYMELLSLKSRYKYGTITSEINFWWNLIGSLSKLIYTTEFTIKFPFISFKTTNLKILYLFFPIYLIIDSFSKLVIFSVFFCFTFGNYSKKVLIIFDEPERQSNPDNWKTINRCLETRIPFVLAHTNEILHLNKFIKERLKLPLYFGEVIDLKIYFDNKEDIENKFKNFILEHSYLKVSEGFIDILENQFIIYELKLKEKQNAILNIEIFLNKIGSKISDYKNDKSDTSGLEMLRHYQYEKYDWEKMEKDILEINKNSKEMINYFQIIYSYYQDYSYLGRYSHLIESRDWDYKIIIKKSFYNYFINFIPKQFGIISDLNSLLFENNPSKNLKKFPNLIKKEINVINNSSSFGNDGKIFKIILSMIFNIFYVDFLYPEIYDKFDIKKTNNYFNCFKNNFIFKYNYLIFNDLLDWIIDYFQCQDLLFEGGLKEFKWDKYKAKRPIFNLNKIKNIKNFKELSMLYDSELEKLIQHYNSQKNIDKIRFLFLIIRSRTSDTILNYDKNYRNFIERVTINEPTDPLHKGFYEHIMRMNGK